MGWAQKLRKYGVNSELKCRQNLWNNLEQHFAATTKSSDD